MTQLVLLVSILLAVNRYHPGVFFVNKVIVAYNNCLHRPRYELIPSSGLTALL